MEKQKPTVEIFNAIVQNNRLIGTVYDHPKLGQYMAGKYIKTSEIIGFNGLNVETNNTLYKVISWSVEPEKKSQKQLLFEAVGTIQNFANGLAQVEEEDAKMAGLVVNDYCTDLREIIKERSL